MERFFQGLIAAAAIAGQVIESGILRGTYRKDMYAYYTNLSNVLVLLYFLGLFLVPANTRLYRYLTEDGTAFAVMMSIMLTFTVFHFILVPALRRKTEKEGIELSFTLGNFLVHYFVPLMTYGYWCIFGPKEQLDFVTGTAWLCIPVAYLLYTWMRVQNGRNIDGTDSPYPYFFMDPGKVGRKRAVLNVAGMTLACVLAGVLIIGIVKTIFLLGR